MTTDDVWEYAERYYEIRGHPLVDGSFISKEIWDRWEPIAFELMRADLNAGWQVDQSAWGSYCIKYEKRRINLLANSAGAWVVYILIGFITYGIGFLVAPFFMNRDYMQFNGIEVRLMKKRK
jgi:hypothetical protein